MRHMFLSLLCAGIFSADYSADALIFGFSKHVDNNNNYKYNEFNPGVGVAFWRQMNGYYNEGDDGYTSFGVIAADYKNSYYKNSFLYGFMVKQQFGENDSVHGGLLLGIGHVTGYNSTPLYNGLAGMFIGYNRINLNVTYIPGSDAVDTEQPASSCFAGWVSITVWRN